MKRVLFFCMGNICRSPMAEGIFRDFLRKRGITGIECESAGMHAMTGWNATENSVIACEEIGVDIKNHIARQITDEFLGNNSFDIFVPLDSSNEADFLKLTSGRLKLKTHLLNGGVKDPYGMSLEGYRRTRDDISEGIKKLMPVVLDYRVVKMDESHLDTIAELERNSFVHPWSRKALESELDNEHSIFLVAESGSEIAGYMGMHYTLDEGNIANLAVFKKFRGTGAAKFLLNSLEEHCREKSISKLILEVREKNIAARSLYRKIGFVEEGTRNNYYTDPCDNAIMMSKIL